MSTFWWGVVVYIIGLIITPFILYYEGSFVYYKAKAFDTTGTAGRLYT